MPPIGDLRISPLPRQYIRSNPPPDITLPDYDSSTDSGYPLRKLLFWVLNPAPEEHLTRLYHFGRISAQKWVGGFEKGDIVLEKLKPRRETDSIDNVIGFARSNLSKFRIQKPSSIVAKMKLPSVSQIPKLNISTSNFMRKITRKFF